MPEFTTVVEPEQAIVTLSLPRLTRLIEYCLPAIPAALGRVAVNVAEVV